ncbi:MAG: tetratricopeptide repeat protein [Clostridia bacterium]|nr:tetratricopeptide repeat protein [Clostridia bacterium]MDD3970758.1 tetratricopeptide repeat protein [Clostridia bacterium]MDD4543624.1 tetratricopeptide repeat protein [Clostridia bacterium]
MDINELQKYLEKIDFSALSKDNVKLSEDDAYVGELYNSAIDNIKQDNIDVARIKLARVVKLDPTFQKAKILLDKINGLERDKSLGEKMEEALDKKDDRPKEKKVTKNTDQVKTDKTSKKNILDKNQIYKKRSSITLPSRNKKMTPLAFIKIQMVIIIALLVVILVLIAVMIGMKKKFDNYVSVQPDLMAKIETLEQEQEEQEALYQSTVTQYNTTIADLESRLSSSDTDIEAAQKESEMLTQKNYLYYGKYLASDLKYNDALSTLLQIELEKAFFTESELKLYDETLELSRMNIAISLYNSGNKLYQDLKYKEAFSNFYEIWNYYPDYQLVAKWEGNTVYSNLVYDSVYKMSRCAYEIGEFNTAISGYEFIEKSNSEFANANIEGLIYHSAKAYAGIEDYVKAEQLFQKVINEYPNSELVTYAKERLSAVQDKLGR